MEQQQKQIVQLSHIEDIEIYSENIHGIATDSGYSSHNSITVSSPNASSHRSSVSSHLQPIYENIEVNSFLLTPEKVTPTTKNIQRFDAFHITTPNSSLKRSAINYNTSGTPKKRCLAWEVTSENIFTDDENSENQDFAQVEFSPICNKSMSNVLQDKSNKFVRKVSFSSTPICESPIKPKTLFFPTNSQIIRRAQSFSPSKAGKQPGLSKFLSEALSEYKADKSFNPAQNLIESSPRKFQNLIRNRDKLTTVRNTFCDDKTNVIEKDINCKTIEQRKSFRRQSAVDIKDTSLLNSPSTSLDLSQNNNKLLENVILPTENTPVSSKSECKLSPAKRSLKKLRRNLTFNLSPKKDDKDKSDNVKSPISTPQLNEKCTAKRRTTSTESSRSAKRPLFETRVLPKRKSLAHRKFLDIITYLSETTTPIRTIFKYLDGKDFASMYNVSKSWRLIVNNDTNASTQRLKFLNARKRNKENLQRKRPPLLRGNTLPILRSVSTNLLPVKKQWNFHIREESIVIQIPDESAIRHKCPKCKGSSLVTKQSANQLNIYDDAYDFATCTNIHCQFKYCVKCLSDYHGTDRCRGKPFVMSSLDDSDYELETDNKIEHKIRSKRDSRRNLRRLCSLEK